MSRPVVGPSGGSSGSDAVRGREGHVVGCPGCERVLVGGSFSWECWEFPGNVFNPCSVPESAVGSAVDPSHYVFPGGVQVKDVSQHLTSFGGQAVQYVARATRLDGRVKGEPVEDLRKAIRMLEWEVERLGWLAGGE